MRHRASAQPVGLRCEWPAPAAQSGDGAWAVSSGKSLARDDAVGGRDLRGLTDPTCACPSRILASSSRR